MEMFQGHGQFLERSPEVGLGEVSGVACLGEQAKIGEFEYTNHGGHCFESNAPRGLSAAGMKEHGSE